LKAQLKSRVREEVTPQDSRGYEVDGEIVDGHNPVMPGDPPEATEQRIFTAPAGTATVSLRLVKVEFARVLTHPALLVPTVTKSVAAPTWALAPSKNRTVRRISGSLKWNNSYHWMIQHVAGTGVPAERDVRIPFAIAVVICIGIHHGQAWLRLEYLLVIT
jgi:hypothetical protein